MKQRYSEYKSSGVEWIGEIPSHWKTSLYKYNITILSGFPFKSELFDKEEGFPLMRIRDITSGTVETFYKGDFDENYVIKEGDIVIGMDGEFNVRQWDNIDILLNQRCCKVQDVKGINRRFIFYTLPFDLKIINDLTYYTTVKHLSVDDIKNIHCVIPPIDEQEQIVKYLDEKTTQIDQLISITEKKIEGLKEKRTSLINHVVTKGLDSNVEMKDSGVEWIGKIPKHWERTTIKRLVTTKLTDGPHLTPNFVDEGVPFISVESIKDYKIDFEYKRGCISKEDDIEFTKKCKPRRDDILFVKSGSTTGKVTIVDTDLDFNVWSPLCLIRPNTRKVLPRFVFHSMKSDFFQLSVQQSWSFGTQPNIGMGVIENLYLIVPPVHEQEQIIEHIDTQNTQMDTLISIEQLRIETLKEYRQSLISEVVTGKIRVTHNNQT